jgi:hypothetical protein
MKDREFQIFNAPSPNLTFRSRPRRGVRAFILLLVLAAGGLILMFALSGCGQRSSDDSGAKKDTAPATTPSGDAAPKPAEPASPPKQ